MAGGYWLVAADGGIFTFGDAQFYGSTGNIRLNKPIVGMTATPSGQGYWFTASDGGVFAFGDAQFYGSLGSTPQSRPIVSITSTSDGGGYWFTNNNGAVSEFGDATYWGSAPQVINKPVVGMAEAAGTGNFSASTYQSGSFGYDISKWQYPAISPTAPRHRDRASRGGVRPQPVQQPLSGIGSRMGGGGLNLYVYLAFATAGSSGDPACAASESPGACNYGFNTAQAAYNYAAATGVNTSVAWWLDVEADPSWSGDLAANASLVQGAIEGLQSLGLNSVGIYSQQSHWSSIVGGYSPVFPSGSPTGAQLPPFNPAQYCSGVWSFASGPVELVQYTNGANTNGFDSDYAC